MWCKGRGARAVVLLSTKPLYHRLPGLLLARVSRIHSVPLLRPTLSSAVSSPAWVGGTVVNRLCTPIQSNNFQLSTLITRLGSTVSLADATLQSAAARLCSLNWALSAPVFHLSDQRAQGLPDPSLPSKVCIGTRVYPTFGPKFGCPSLRGQALISSVPVPIVQ